VKMGENERSVLNPAGLKMDEGEQDEEME